MRKLLKKILNGIYWVGTYVQNRPKSSDVLYGRSFILLKLHFFKNLDYHAMSLAI